MKQKKILRKINQKNNNSEKQKKLLRKINQKKIIQKNRKNCSEKFTKKNNNSSECNTLPYCCASVRHYNVFCRWTTEGRRCIDPLSCTSCLLLACCLLRVRVVNLVKLLLNVTPTPFCKLRISCLITVSRETLLFLCVLLPSGILCLKYFLDILRNLCLWPWEESKSTLSVIFQMPFTWECFSLSLSLCCEWLTWSADVLEMYFSSTSIQNAPQVFKSLSPINAHAHIWHFPLNRFLAVFAEIRRRQSWHLPSPVSCTCIVSQSTTKCAEHETGRLLILYLLPSSPLLSLSPLFPAAVSLSVVHKLWGFFSFFFFLPRSDDKMKAQRGR